MLKKFAPHEDFLNIDFPELPLRMEGPSDYDDTDSEVGWPTRLLDLRRDVESSRSAIERLRSGIWMALTHRSFFFDKLHLVIIIPKPFLDGHLTPLYWRSRLPCADFFSLAPGTPGVINGYLHDGIL